MSVFSLTELTDLETSISVLLPDAAFSAATKYNNALSSPVSVRVILIPPPRLVARQSAVDFEQISFAASNPVPTPGDVVNFTTLDGVNRWFIVVKLLTLGPEIATRIPVNALVIEMPYLLTVQRPVTSPSLPATNIWGDVSNPSAVSVHETALHVGFTNNLNQLGEAVVGPLPSGELTAYTYLGADVQTDDAVDFNGLHYIVDQVNQKDANGWLYGLEILMKESGGKTWPNG